MLKTCVKVKLTFSPVVSACLASVEKSGFSVNRFLTDFWLWCFVTFVRLTKCSRFNVIYPFNRARLIICLVTISCFSIARYFGVLLKSKQPTEKPFSFVSFCLIFISECLSYSSFLRPKLESRSCLRLDCAKHVSMSTTSSRLTYYFYVMLFI